jgi:hypothetical protein
MLSGERIEKDAVNSRFPMCPPCFSLARPTRFDYIRILIPQLFRFATSCYRLTSSPREAIFLRRIRHTSDTLGRKQWPYLGVNYVPRLGRGAWTTSANCTCVNKRSLVGNLSNQAGWHGFLGECSAHRVQMPLVQRPAIQTSRVPEPPRCTSKPVPPRLDH